MAKSIRLEDLATIAGVSIATVSRALNNNPAVSEQTKQRIWKLAREHGYLFRPHMPTSPDRAVATVSIVVPAPQGRDAWLTDPFFMELLSGIGEAARDRRCNLMLSHSTPRSFDDLARLVDDNYMDSAIFLGQSNFHDAFNRLASRDNILWSGVRNCPGSATVRSAATTSVAAAVRRRT